MELTIKLRSVLSLRMSTELNGTYPVHFCTGDLKLSRLRANWNFYKDGLRVFGCGHDTIRKLFCGFKIHTVLSYLLACWQDGVDYLKLINENLLCIQVESSFGDAPVSQAGIHPHHT